MNGLITVIGATGKTGRRVVARLEEAGHPVRGVSRSTVPAFDWEQPAGWARALADTEALYVTYVPDLAAPQAAPAIAELVDVAGQVGVGRIVLLSGRGEAGARRCEDIVLESAIAATVVRASWFSQNFTEGMLADALVTGVLGLPAGSVREPFVDLDDVADVVVAALTGEGHAGRVHEVTGPELLSFADAAAIMSAASGRAVDYVALESEEFRQAVATEAGAEVADLLTELCREVFDGRNESTTDGVREVLGREPRGLSEVVADALAGDLFGGSEAPA